MFCKCLEKLLKAVFLLIVSDRFLTNQMQMYDTLKIGFSKFLSWTQSKICVLIFVSKYQTTKYLQDDNECKTGR